MVRPQFSFFITQPDGKIFGSAVDPDSGKSVGYLISTDGSVTARQDNCWRELPSDDAVFVRFVAGQAYRFTQNYLTQNRVF